MFLEKRFLAELGEAVLFEVVHGACPDSPDVDAAAWGERMGLVVTPFPANWERYGRAAGKLRNLEMANYAVACRGPAALLAVWDGESPGTANMIAHAVERGLHVVVKRVKKGRS